MSRAEFLIADSELGLFHLSRCVSQGMRLESPRDALMWGYNPCPQCRPLYTILQASPHPLINLPALMLEVKENPQFRIKEQGLRERELDPNQLRHLFQERLGMTFQETLRMRRINQRFGPILHGGSRGLCRARQRPDAARAVLTRLDTPLGPMMAAASLEGLVLLEFADRRMLETQFTRLEKRHNVTLQPGTADVFPQLQSELAAYFQGELRRFSLVPKAEGSQFQMRVWEQLQHIAWGRRCSYGELAADLNRPRAVRAVARAIGENPVAIITPCHRVIGADGSLTGYGGGLWRKEALLRLETEGDAPR